MGVTVTCCEDVEKRSTIFSYISGGLLAIGLFSPCALPALLFTQRGGSSLRLLAQRQR